MPGILDPDYDLWTGKKIKKKKNNLFGVNAGLFGPERSKNEKIDSRRQISRSEKNAVWEAQKGKCKICGKPLIPSATHYDHIKEYSRGGRTDISNIQALCANCHAKKTNQDRINHIKNKKHKSKDY